MKNKYNVLITSLLAMWLFFGLNACSDDSSSGVSEEDCNTSLPSEFAPAQVDIQYFSSQNVPQDEEHSNFQMVSQTATTGGAFLSGGASFGLASSLLAYAQFSGVQPEASNGSCVWDFSQIPGYQGLGLTISANPTSNGVNWEVRATGDIGDQEGLDDFKLISGFTSSDEQQGEWNYYDPETPNSAVITYTWDIESEDSYQLNLTTAETEGGVAISYSKNGAENSMTFDDGEGGVTNLFWNTETDSGWIEPDGGERMCYTDFVNSACS